MKTSSIKSSSRQSYNRVTHLTYEALGKLSPMPASCTLLPFLLPLALSLPVPQPPGRADTDAQSTNLAALPTDRSSALTYLPLPPEMRLRAVFVITSPGNRAPLSSRAGNFTVLPSFWSEQLPSQMERAAWQRAHPIEGATPEMDDSPFGMLTSLGAEQARSYGSELRARYSNLAPRLLANVSARATNTPSSQQSAQNLLLGLSPARCSVGVRRSEEESLVPAPQSCPKLATAIAQAESLHRASPRDSFFKQAVGELLEYPRGELQLDQAWGVLAATLAHSHAAGAQSLPGWLRAEDVQRLTGIHEQASSAKYGAKAVSRLAMGRLIHELEAALTEVVNNQDVSELRLLSGDDTTLAPLLVALGVDDARWPSESAHLEIELASASDGSHHLRLLHDGKPLAIGQRSDPLMRWEEFSRHVLQPVSIPPHSFSRECEEASFA